MLQITANPYWPDDEGHVLWDLGYRWGVAVIWSGSDERSSAASRVSGGGADRSNLVIL